MRSEYKNFVLNAIYQIATYIFPLITIPYISRILGVSNIGIYSYTYSIVSIFMLFGMLGLNNYGNREIAKVRDDKNLVSKCFISIYTLQFVINLCTIIGYLIYAYLICSEYKIICKIQIIYILSLIFDVNWFYFGLEKFKMTITRNLIIKVSSIILIFLFVKESNDLWVYALIISLSTLLSQLYLFLNLRRFIILKKINIKESFVHLKSVLLLFIPVLAYSIYRVMDKIMIGYISSVVELGYYENAERLINIPISIISALGIVMLPRMSYLISKKEGDYRSVILNSMQLVLILSTIMAFGLFVISDEISLILFGPEFIKCGVIIKAISITIIISAWANVIRTQYVIPKRLDSIYVKSTIGGAVINLVSNLIFIRLYGAVGACIGTVLAESYVMLYQSFKCKDDLNLERYFKILLKYLIHSLFIVVIACFLTYNIDNLVIRLLARILIIVVLFLGIERNFIYHHFLGK